MQYYKFYNVVLLISCGTQKFGINVSFHYPSILQRHLYINHSHTFRYFD